MLYAGAGCGTGSKYEIKHKLLQNNNITNGLYIFTYITRMTAWHCIADQIILHACI